jgi:two-component system NtrC family sensor kinase
MILPDFRTYPERHHQHFARRKDHDPDQQLSLVKLIVQSFKSVMPRLGIAKKINYGYALVIGIAVFGTTVGLGIGDYYHKKAQQKLTLAYQQQSLLRDLENAVLEMRSHPQRLATVLGDSIWFDYESSKFFAEVTQVQNFLNELERFIQEHPNNLAVETDEFEQIVNTYTQATQSYQTLVESWWQTIDSSTLKAEKIPLAQQQLLSLTQEKNALQIGVEFERLSEKLAQIIDTAKLQQNQAKVQLNQAEELRLQIIIITITISTMFAIAFGLYTSRQIARPIEWLNQVAKQVTQHSNFCIIAPVTTDDEVGSLATSLNQLVQWVGQYTYELEVARQTLEERVKERTQELTHALHELKHTQAQLIQSEKMSSLGQLVGGIAHEINNPVNFIYGNIDHAHRYVQDLLGLIVFCQNKYATDPELEAEIAAVDLEFLQQDLPQLLSSMKMGTDRIRRIVLSLRNFSRLDEATAKEVDLHEGIENTLLILNSRLKKGINLIKNYENLPLVECFPAQLNQVLMNILANAIDALEESMQSESLQKIENNKLFPAIKIETQKLNSYEIQIKIWNNGPLIPPEVKSKLFDPFFTTKPVGQGTGLGLAICYQIIEKHQGKIEVASELEKGTEFVITIPIQLNNLAL